MRRVLVITTSYPAYSGDAAGHFVETEVLELSRTQHVTLLAPRVPSSSRRNLEIIGLGAESAFGFPGAALKLQRNPWLAVNAVCFVERARRALRALPAFDHVIAHWIVPSALPIASAASRTTEGTFEIVAHGSDVRLLQKLPRPFRHHLLTTLLERGATFRFVSHELRDALTRCGPPNLAQRSRVAASPIRIAVDLERPTARAELDVAEHEKLAVVVGRLIRGKRTDVAIRAGLLAGARVVVIGDGPERARLQRTFGSAMFLGQCPRDRTLNVIAAADILLSASRTEGAPTVIREARALGTAVVTTRAGDVAQWAKHDAHTLVVD